MKNSNKCSFNWFPVTCIINIVPDCFCGIRRAEMTRPRLDYHQNDWHPSIMWPNNVAQCSFGHHSEWLFGRQAYHWRMSINVTRQCCTMYFPDYNYVNGISWRDHRFLSDSWYLTWLPECYHNSAGAMPGQYCHRRQNLGKVIIWTQELNFNWILLNCGLENFYKTNRIQLLEQ